MRYPKKAETLSTSGEVEQFKKALEQACKLAGFQFLPCHKLIHGFQVEGNPNVYPELADYLRKREQG